MSGEKGGVPEAWREVRIGEIANVTRGASPRPAGDSRYFNGDYLPWVTVGEITNKPGMYLCSTDSFLTEAGAKFTRIIQPNTLLLTNSGATLGVPKITQILCGANDGVAVISELKSVTNEYFYYLLDRSILAFRTMASGVGQPNLNTDLISEFSILLPPLPEQRKIAAILSTWDDALATLGQLLKAKHQQKRGLAEALLTGKKRLPGFEGKWEKKNLREMVVEYSHKSTENDLYPVITSAKSGIYLQSEYFKKSVSSEDTTGYKIVPRGYLTFRSMSDTGDFTFNRQDILDNAIISPAYGVFKFHQIDPDFGLYLMNGKPMKDSLARVTQGGTRIALKISSFKEFNFLVPGLPEQQAIASILSTLDDEIASLEALKAKVQEQKRGLMDELLTGRVRVKVEETC
ncbi:hypothetical protein Dxin01_03484 [Deinococcus xinjiangensis]|uniref:Type I restriction modification DNA specificity domain-containing protein n=1 Tax=Deinococcus xinjiangensis TaxID=457454 RepID=A0ABP9VK10_9DEIO